MLEDTTLRLPAGFDTSLGPQPPWLLQSPEFGLFGLSVFRFSSLQGSELELRVEEKWAGRGSGTTEAVVVAGVAVVVVVVVVVVSTRGLADLQDTVVNMKHGEL